MLKNYSRGLHVFFEDKKSKILYQSSVTGDEESVDQLNIQPIDRSKHEGIQEAYYGYGKLHSISQDEQGPSVQIYASIYGPNDYAFELGAFNDSIRNAPGRMDGKLVVLLNGRKIYDDDVQLHDETGASLRYGDFRWAPRRDILDPILAEFPDVQVPESRLNAMRRVHDDPDEVHYTHTTGSPRNKGLALPFSLYHYGPKRREDTRSCHDWVLAQVGMTSNIEKKFIPGRPHWLVDDETGKIYDNELNYFVDGLGKHPQFGENGIIIKAQNDTFGRIHLDSDLTGRGTRLATDIEHHEVESLFAAAVLLGSEFAYRGVEMLAQFFMDKNLAESGIHHNAHYWSSRTLGWGVRAIVRAYQLTGNEKYRKAFRDILKNVFTYPKRVYKKWLQESPYDTEWVLLRESMWAGQPGKSWERPWQASTVGDVCFLAAQADDDPEWIQTFKDWGTYVADCILKVYRPEGVYREYNCENTENGQPTQFNGDTSPLGTPLWHLNTLMRAWLHTNDPKYKEKAQWHWDAVKGSRAGGHHFAKPGGDLYHQRAWLCGKYLD